jgi:protein-S-isoprenylcysteine O-methyltransferase Ste14
VVHELIRQLKALSIVGYLGMIVGLLGLLATSSLFSPSPVVIVPQILALLLLVWARLTFGRRSFHFAANPTAGGLVTTGPYRYIRHPIYTAVCLFAGAGAAAHWSWTTAAFGGLVLAGALVRLLCEEKLVAARYPEYRPYASKTWRVIPYVF